jgi:hypothetical protein
VPEPPVPTRDSCSFTDPKKAAAFGNVFLAKFWDDILKMDCNETAILTVFQATFDEAVVFSVNGRVIANNFMEPTPVLLQIILPLCNSQDFYLSWLTLYSNINPGEKNVITIVTKSCNQHLRGSAVLGIHTRQVLGKECDESKITAVTVNRTLTLEMRSSSRWELQVRNYDC